MVFKINYRHRLALVFIALIAAVLHGWNMMAYPYFENDEGTYMAQAWSVVTKGQLAPYTYWYDHAPAGWIVIALWTIATGGFFTFGLSVESGRMLMLIIQIACSLLVFEITYLSTRKKIIAGIVAALIFASSPIGIYFHRRVLLDNIMTFWTLISWWLLLKDKLSLRRIAMSAIALGCAVLTKENAIFFIPPLALLVWLKSHPEQKRFALLTWGFITVAVISLYPLYALVKTELLPDASGHKVSLIGSLKMQLSRGQGKSFWMPGSDFRINLSDWTRKDAFIIYGGWFAILIACIAGFWNVSSLVGGLMGTFFWIFLLRGGLIIDFYIVPHIALASIALGSVFSLTSHLWQQVNGKIMLGLLIVGIIGYNGITGIQAFTNDETSPQKQAIQYIYDHYDLKKHIAIDAFAFVDLRVNGYDNAEWFWKIWGDPAITAKYNGDWRNVEVLMVGHEFLRQMGLQPKDSILSPAYDYADMKVQYGPNNPNTYIDKKIFLTTNGDWMSIYEIPSMDVLAGKQAWRHYKETFIHSYGQVIDPQTQTTTSEGQSYAMLMSVWQDDESTFNGVWSWTKDHMQHRQNDHLLSWQWGKNAAGQESLLDSSPASDADQDIALALIFAYHQWNNPLYLEEARAIIKDIWQNEVVSVKKHYILTASVKPMYQDYYIVNPSYFAPAAYRIFAQVEPLYPWNELAQDSYIVLNELSSKSQSHLPPNWILINKNNYQFASAKPVYGDMADEFGYDAFRATWRVAQDAQWFDTPEAKKYLQAQSQYFTTQWQMRQKFYAVINSATGENVVDYSKLSTSAAALAAIHSTDAQLSQQIYQSIYIDRFNSIKGYWDDGSNYYDQSWAWFATQQYVKQTPNLAAK